MSEYNKGKSIEIDPEPSHPKVARGLGAGKCLLQAPTTLRYVIRSDHVGEHTIHEDHALIGKFWVYGIQRGI
jgi:hypothetical protein